MWMTQIKTVYTILLLVFLFYFIFLVGAYFLIEEMFEFCFFFTLLRDDRDSVLIVFPVSTARVLDQIVSSLLL